MRLEDAFAAIMRIGDEVGIRADNHEEIVNECLAKFEGGDQELGEWLRRRLLTLFPSMGQRPKWIQEEEWPVSPSGKPLVFLGQVDVKPSALFHDDTSFYLFFDAATGETEVVTQQA